ncbi:MAG: murein biosynthesis integral membrane protein MurJ [Patescibacteria group bacterium]
MKGFWAVFQKKQHSIGSAAFILMSMVLASRVLGLVRDRMLSARFSPDDLGVYFAAFRLPNLLFELLVMGAFTSAFIPVFTKYIAKNQENDAYRMAATLINVCLVILLVLMVPLFVWTGEISQFLAPGFSVQQIDQMIMFTRIMMVSQVVPLLVGNFFTGILQSYNLFLVPALAPVVYNVGIIAGILLLTPAMGLYAPVVGVGIGAVLFLAIQIPLIVAVGYRHRMIADLHQKGVQEGAALIGPRTLGLAVSQIDTTVDLILATLLGARMVTIFNFAQHLQQLPVGLFGITIAQAALPMLSLASVKEDTESFKKSILSAMHQILFFVLPVSVLFIVLRIPIVRLVFGASRFDWAATVATGMTLSAFSISLFAQSLIHVLARGFYALYDTKTPVVIGIIAIIINTVLSIVFIQLYKLPVWSLGLSTSIASFVNAGLLLVLLDKRLHAFSRKELLLPPLQMFVAALVAGVIIYIPLKLLDQLVFDTTRTFGLLLLTGSTGFLGLSTYFFIAWVLGVGEVHSFIRLLKKVRRSGAVLLTPASEVVNGGVQDKLS